MYLRARGRGGGGDAEVGHSPGGGATASALPLREGVGRARRRRLLRVWAVSAVLIAQAALVVSPAAASVEASGLQAGVVAQVSVTPTSGGMPGGALAQKLLNWTSQVALWGSLTSLLVGAMVWGLSQHMGNGMHAGRGRTFAMAGAVGALLAGLAPTIINTLFGAAG